MRTALDEPPARIGLNVAVRTVLVVDDEPLIRDVVARYLEREGFRVVECGDGETARALVERHEPDLVVLDVMLPGTDGLRCAAGSAGGPRRR